MVRTTISRLQAIASCCEYSLPDKPCHHATHALEALLGFIAFAVLDHKCASQKTRNVHFVEFCLEGSCCVGFRANLRKRGCEEIPLEAVDMSLDSIGIMDCEFVHRHKDQSNFWDWT
jgi:hypothetical protein